LGTGAQSSMKSSLMKLNHVSTFSGEGHLTLPISYIVPTTFPLDLFYDFL